MAKLLPEIAKAVAAAIPELEGRAVAVSEVQPFASKLTVPTLPIATVGLINERASQSKTGGGRIRLESDIAIFLFLEPVKYTLKNGADSAFFAYYDYEDIRDRILSYIRNKATIGANLSYNGLAVNSDEFAVYIELRFTATDYQWCDPYKAESFEQTVGVRLLEPTAGCCDTTCTKPKQAQQCP